MNVVPRERTPASRRALSLVLGALFFSCGSPAEAGLYHYPWCETIRARCYAKAHVRKAECNWRYDYAKRHRVDGLSKWPAGVSNYCFVYPQSAKSDAEASSD